MLHCDSGKLLGKQTLILCGLYCAALPGMGQQLVGDDTKGRRDKWEGNTNNINRLFHTYTHTERACVLNNRTVHIHSKKELQTFVFIFLTQQIYVFKCFVTLNLVHYHINVHFGGV